MFPSRKSCPAGAANGRKFDGHSLLDASFYPSGSAKMASVVSSRKDTKDTCTFQALQYPNQLKMSSATSQPSASVPACTAASAGETVYSNLSKAEFDTKILEVQTETREQVKELIETKESGDLEASEVLEMLDAASEYFDDTRSILVEVGRRKALPKEDRPSLAAGVAAVAKMKHDLGVIEKMREEYEVKLPNIKPEKVLSAVRKNRDDGEYDDRDTVVNGIPADRTREEMPSLPATISVGASSGSTHSRGSFNGDPIDQEEDTLMGNGDEVADPVQGSASLNCDQASSGGGLLRRTKRSPKPIVRYEGGPASGKRSKSTPSTSSRGKNNNEAPLPKENAAVASVNNNRAPAQEMGVVKREKTYRDLRVADHRKYGDRHLLVRGTGGIGRLGGGHVDTFPKPCKEHPRLRSEIGDLVVGCYSDIWQGYVSPQHAGSDGFVDWVPETVEDGKEIALFMRRSLTKPHAKGGGKLLGWEYCGIYKYGGDPDIEDMHESALSFSPASKKKIARKVFEFSKSKDGYGRYRLDYWRRRLKGELVKDKSPPGPRWIVERRSPSEEERKERPYPLAARARALGFKAKMTDEALSHLIVHLDENYTLVPIEFVRYDEAVYDYVKAGKTNKNAKGDMKVIGEEAAKASDWYAFFDTLSI